jgi:hypothetical protein
MWIKVDVSTARTLAAAPADALATFAMRNDVFVTPKVGAVLSGRGARAIRTAVDAGEIASEGRVHRYVNAIALARWSGRENFSNEQWARCFERIARGSESGARAAV